MELSAFDLSGKVALITGGAHGIGFSIAEGMARCGATICFNCSSQSSYEKGMAAYQAAASRPTAMWPTSPDWDAVSAMVDKIAARGGPGGHPGQQRRHHPAQADAGDQQRGLRACHQGPRGGRLQLLQGGAARHDRKRAGKIINICSMMSELGRETVSGYAAAKAASRC